MFARFAKLVVFVLITELAGIMGSVFTFPAIQTWYVTLEKPPFTPPNWLFGPAWTILYFLMGVSAFLIWEKGFAKKEVRLALAIFGVQLVFNIIWSFLFFGLRSPNLAFAEIIPLWLTIAATIVVFYKISKPASYLLIPYILWTTFAAVLNFSIVQLN